MVPVLTKRTVVQFVLLIAAYWAAAPSDASDFAIVAATIYPSPDSDPISNGIVVIHDGHITAVGKATDVAVPRDARRLAAPGGAIMAGFWNSHVHILTHDLLHADGRSSAELSAHLEEMFTRWGFTTVFDLASVLDNTNVIRRRIESGDVHGPNILTVGEPFYPPNGTPIYIKQFLADEHLDSPEVTSIPQAVERERDEIKRGADAVKLFTGAIVGGTIGVLPMPLPMIQALTNEAHAQHKQVFAHPSNVAGLNAAIDGGVDILAHTAPMAGPWNAEMIARLLQHHMALIPTLTLFEVEARKFGESPQDEASDIATAVGQLRAFALAHGEILFGTDVGYTDAYDTAEEFALMHRAGLDVRAILASLTTTPASRFGFSRHKGRVAPGMDADLVVLQSDPAVEITAFSRVLFTIRAGQVTYRSDGR